MHFTLVIWSAIKSARSITRERETVSYYSYKNLRKGPFCGYLPWNRANHSSQDILCVWFCYTLAKLGQWRAIYKKKCCLYFWTVVETLENCFARLLKLLHKKSIDRDIHIRFFFLTNRFFTSFLRRYHLAITHLCKLRPTVGDFFLLAFWFCDQNFPIAKKKTLLIDIQMI